MTELWRDIPGWPDYQASTEGRVRSWKRYRGSDAPRIVKGTVRPDRPGRACRTCKRERDRKYWRISHSRNPNERNS